ncbi:MAG: hypothetical protein J0L62_02235 [Bacteroidetes bacterium]|nr:hypothetical protein [Bacteroidota bacterium]
MIPFFSPLTGKADQVADFVIRHLNSLFRTEKMERVPALEISEDLVVVWDYQEEEKKYLKLPCLLFIPFSRDAEQLWFRKQPVNLQSVQNYRIREQELLCLFPVNRQSAQAAEISGESVLFQADLISQLFVLLTGWDEQFSEKDKLKRVIFKNSLIDKLGLINRAFADETCAAIMNGYQALGIPESFRFYDGFSWQITFTHDLDHLKKWTPGYFSRKLLQSRSSFKELQTLATEFKTSFSEKDPFETALEEIRTYNNDQKVNPIYFLRSGKSDKRDSRISFKHKLIGNLVEDSKAGLCRLGIHPTIKSAFDPEQFYKDWQELSSAIPSVERVNRQHFLMFDPVLTPTVHRDLRIEEDYTIGFHDQEGFRRSSVHPFQGFDFNSWSLTETNYIPLIAMDATFTDYRKCSALESIQSTERLLKEVKNWQGHCSILFHNSFTRDKNPDWWSWYESAVQFSIRNHALLK